MINLNYFKLSEFDCPYCGQNKMHKSFLKRLDLARKIAGVPFVITSGYRCPKRNKEVGGKFNSSHLIGVAADIKCETSYMRSRIIYGLMKAGFIRIGIGRNFIHADDDVAKAQEVMWLY